MSKKNTGDNQKFEWKAELHILWHRQKSQLWSISTQSVITSWPSRGSSPHVMVNRHHGIVCPTCRRLNEDFDCSWLYNPPKSWLLKCPRYNFFCLLLINFELKDLRIYMVPSLYINTSCFTTGPYSKKISFFFFRSGRDTFRKRNSPLRLISH